MPASSPPRARGARGLSHRCPQPRKTSNPRRGCARADNGLLNDFDYPEGHANHGLPFPGTFITDAIGIIRTKEFEKTYQERRRAASFLALAGDEPGASVSETRNEQFNLRSSLSNAAASVGQRVTLVLDFSMAPRMHAYAPGVKGYRPLNLRLAETPLLSPQ